MCAFCYRVFISRCIKSLWIALKCRGVIRTNNSLHVQRLSPLWTVGLKRKTLFCSFWSHLVISILNRNAGDGLNNYIWEFLCVWIIQSSFFVFSKRGKKFLFFSFAKTVRCCFYFCRWLVKTMIIINCNNVINNEI